MPKDELFVTSWKLLGHKARGERKKTVFFKLPTWNIPNQIQAEATLTLTEVSDCRNWPGPLPLLPNIYKNPHPLPWVTPSFSLSSLPRLHFSRSLGAVHKWSVCCNSRCGWHHVLNSQVQWNKVHHATRNDETCIWRNMELTGISLCFISNMI